jgi:hypothetical protein
MVYEYTLNVMPCFFLFVDLKSKLADNTCLGEGPQFYSWFLRQSRQLSFVLFSYFSIVWLI